jgi:hypothetical protein
MQGFVDSANTAAATAEIRCTFGVSAPGGSTLNPIGPLAFMGFNAAISDHKTLSLAASAVVPAGTYDVGIICTMLSGAASAYSGAINVVAAPTSAVAPD